jgi:tripartite-type tricarboxylate transporter receptor subunit TctC
VTGNQRLAAQPAARTFQEQGVEGMDVSFWWGLLAPAKTPAAVVAAINKELASAVADPELVASFAAQGLDLRSSTPEAFSRLISSDVRHWRAAAESAKVKLTGE